MRSDREHQTDDETATGSHALALLADRCAARLDDAAGVLAAIRETAQDVFGRPATCLLLRSQTRELVPVGAVASDEALVEPRSLSVNGWPAVAAALEGLRAAPAPDPPEPILLHSPVAVPLAAGERSFGVLLIEAGVDNDLHETEGDLLRAFGTVGGALLAGSLEQERLRRLSELENQYIGLAAHELRAPFAVMHGIITTLDHHDDLPEDQAEALRRALVEQSDRTSRLIDQLLDLSRLDASSIPIERSRFPIRNRLEDLVRMVAGDRVGEVAIRVADGLEVDADPAVFDRIVSNLVVNALRHGRAPVTVAARQRDTHLRVTVEDRGRGVDAAFLPKLFDRFARRDGRASETKGSGLGLSIAQSYAQAHGGELVYSPADPHGARFELILPRPPQQAAERSAARTSPA